MPAAASVSNGPLSRSVEVAQRVDDYDIDDEGFDLGGIHQPTFEVKPSRPTTAQRNHSSDSLTLGASHSSDLPIRQTTASRSSHTGMTTPTTSSSSATMEEPEEDTIHNSKRVSTASTSHTVNPATIPIRTSSTHAVGGAQEREPFGMGSSPPKKSPRSRRSLGSVPEGRRLSQQQKGRPDEKTWIGSSSSGLPPYTNGGGSSKAPPDKDRHVSPSFSQQPTLASSPPSSDPLLPHEPDTSIPLYAPTNWTPEKETILKSPYAYLESHPGKDIRAQMIAAFNAWLDVPAPALEIITRVVGMLHTASLLIDDVEDASNLRRGVPVAHSIFGTAQTINSANYVYFCALQELLQLDNAAACVEIYTEELLNLHRGQGMDLFWRDTLTCPSEDDYLEMVGNKTGGLFRLAIKLMCASSPSHTHTAPPQQQDYIPLVNTLGLLFQILDDYRNLSSAIYTANKGLCEDLTEGKFSFPVIHAIRSDPANMVLINILKQKTEDEDVKRYAVSYMEGRGSFGYTRRVLRGLTRKAGGLVDEVDAGRVRGEGVKAILEVLRVERHSRGSQSV